MSAGKVVFQGGNQQAPIAVHVKDVDQWVDDLPADADGCKIIPPQVTSIRDTDGGKLWGKS